MKLNETKRCWSDGQQQHGPVLYSYTIQRFSLHTRSHANTRGTQCGFVLLGHWWLILSCRQWDWRNTNTRARNHLMGMMIDRSGMAIMIAVARTTWTPAAALEWMDWCVFGQGVGWQPCTGVLLNFLYNVHVLCWIYASCCNFRKTSPWWATSAKFKKKKKRPSLLSVYVT